MKKIIVLLIATAVIMMGCGQSNSEEYDEITTADEAISVLQKGNEQYKTGKKMMITTQDLREELTVNGQEPYAVVISCSDSRVPVEEIFSCNAGEIFVVRTAGNVIGDLEMGSIEYGVEHCGAPLILVLGHTNCGAVTAAVEGEPEGNNIDDIVELIKPAIEEAKKISKDKEKIVSEGVRINVLNDIKQIQSNPTISELIDSGMVSVTGAIYDIEHGTIQWLE